ncbi:ABC transporter permease [Vagococcus lutrae]|uniref:methionine ABC transporter permease n=1 Tax=Vagococcus lutrae TaxID=81947 RepID=UPI001C95A146|nr:methionine ABC transporter permease [Vagococcus lutrae]MDT2805306.1 ABC transporter permease [Vagococcus lutrae]MDT2807088.1 ABC transporter permease [Vagococcus lutrae]MDT2812225.1 ABC transporter permease [Vagococcus lutrae]MDT2816347.1 ABC transporter permease [Vagococcus lutrae]MDT2818456.1 ABC transporter permease [Vagococcus lutrae]
MKTNSFMETYFNFEKVKEIDFLQATKETLYMTVISMILVILIGFTIGLLLFYLNRKDTLGHKIMYQVVSIVSSVCRSIPFIILMILIIPFTKALLGTFLGTQAAIPALVISAAPFYGRMVEIALREVDQGVLEAAESMGASTVQIITKVLIPESKPALISGITVTTITMIGFTAMAGAIGAGGLGGLAYYQGYSRQNMTVTMFATILILVLVFMIQYLGDWLVKKVDKRS